MLKNDLMYLVGATCAENLYSLADQGGTLENLIDVVDYYKAHAVRKNSPYFAGIADALWNLIQKHWEYVPRTVMP